ncbi:MAG TPA: hypothetical protein VHO50_11090 [Bacteroidales bacterium]|nr:hypothetical protein [Bacteroidales bacterium]
MEKYFIALCFLLIQIPSRGQNFDYREIFGDNWLKAEAFEKANANWMAQILDENSIPYNVALAVIFPELVRYSALRDKMETTLLKTLYVNLGDQYANFSVGQFQIKPTFAELIRTESARLTINDRFRLPDEFNNISDYRKSIVADLEDTRQSFMYIVAFIKICEVKFNLNTLDEETKIRFLASAYNTGIDHAYDKIIKISENRFFTTNLIGSEKYSYSDVSAYWYRINNNVNRIAH